MQSRIRYGAMAIIVFSILGCAEHITESAETVFDRIASGQRISARFSAIRDSVFTPSCAKSGCHDGTVSPNLTPERAYSQIVNVPNAQKSGLSRVEPGVPGRSYLLWKLTGSNIIGSRMPLGAPPLPSAVIDSVRKWIEDGALPN